MANFNKDRLDQIYSLWTQHVVSGMDGLSAIRTCPSEKHSLSDHVDDLHLGNTDGWHVTDYWTSDDWPSSFLTDIESINEFLKAYDLLSPHWEKGTNFFLIKYGNEGARFVEYIYNFKQAYLNLKEKQEWVSLKEFDHG